MPSRRPSLLTAIIVSGLVSSSGCGTRQAPYSTVRLTMNPLTVQSCRFVGHVKAGSAWSGAAMQLGIAQVERRLQRQAAALGADTVYVGHTVINPSVVHERGEAYRCGGQGARP